MPAFEPTESFARRLDESDPLKDFRARFYLLENTIYVDGNSLGLLSRDAEAALLQTLDEWKTRGIAGWFEGERPWFHSSENISALVAGMMGAEPDEVIHSATTTINIHSLVASFYRPEGKRTRILADELNFPTDIYALKGQLRLAGRRVEDDLVLVPSDDGRTLEETRIVEMMTDDVALVFLPSVLYRSGQLLDMEYLTATAHERGIPIGFDCSHSAGAVPHRLDRWGVDFGVWCAYKYLNSGPGASAFLYVNRKNFDRDSFLVGWFGNRKETQFDMSLDFDPQGTAGKWLISSPGVLGSATLYGSLSMINEAGIENMRDKSLAMTSYLVDLADEFLADPPYSFVVGSPRDPARRGGHVALEREEGAQKICEALISRGVVPDFRPPNVIRICPSPLYGTYHEVWQVVQHLRAIVDNIM